MTRWLVGAAGVLPLLLVAADPGNADEKPELTINEIMVQAHLKPMNRSTRNNLDSRVIDGKASDKEKKQLVDLYEALARAKPPMARASRRRRRSSGCTRRRDGRWSAARGRMWPGTRRCAWSRSPG